MNGKKRSHTPDMSADASTPALSEAWKQLAPFVILVCTIIVYLNSFQGDFILDDHVSIRQNLTIRRLRPITIPLSPPPGTSVSGRPILNLTFALNYAASGLSAWSYHLVNLIIHTAAALFLYGIIRRTLVAPPLGTHYQTRAALLAMIAALIWAVHPLQTESVTYMIQRSESLAGLFYLSTLYCIIRGSGSVKSVLWTITAIVLCSLGMGTKEMAVTIPVMVLVYDCIFLSGSWGQALRRHAIRYIGLAGTWLLLLFVSSGARSGSTGFGIPGYGPLAYGLTQLGVITHYLRLCFWPHPLVMDYLWFIETNPVAIILPGLLIGSLLVLTVAALFRRLPLGFPGVWFFLILAPTSSIIPIATEIAAERRMYLPLAAVAILAVLLVDHAMGLFVGKKSFPAAKRITGIVLVSLCVTVPGLMTIQRNSDYRNPETMWKLVLKNRPLNCRAYFNLGLYYHEHGREEDAITQCNNALECPNESIDISQIHALLANLLSDKGSYEEARRHFEEAIHINPQDVKLMIDYGISLARQNRLERALGVFRQALVLQPDNSIIHYDLGNTLEMQGKFQEAMDHYRESIRLNPEFPEVHRNLGDLLYKEGEWDAALQEYEEALRLKPNWREVQEILNQIHKQKPISKQSPE